MPKIDTKTKINVIGIGIGGSVLIFFVIYTLFARVLSLTILDNMDNYFALLLIILSFEAISVISSILVSTWQMDNINQGNLLAAVIMSYLCNLIAIIVISYGFLMVYYPVVFSEVSGFDIVLIFPQVLISFSIYVLGHPLYLAFLSIFTYYLFFIIFIDQFSRRK